MPLAAARYRNDARHGFDGWLPTDLADSELVVHDEQLLEVLLSAAHDTLTDLLGRPLSPFEGLGSFVDPNDWRVQTHALQGLWPCISVRPRSAGTSAKLPVVRGRGLRELVSVQRAWAQRAGWHGSWLDYRHD